MSCPPSHSKSSRGIHVGPIPFFPLESPSSPSVSSPTGFHGPLLLPVSAPEKICFVFLCSCMAEVQNLSAFVRCVVYFLSATFLLDSMLWGKRETEEGRKLLRAFNPEFWSFFLKTGCCPLSDLTFHVLRMRNKSSHKNPRVGCFERKYQSSIELFEGVGVILLRTVLNSSCFCFSFEVYFMFYCGFQISHALDLGK